MQKKAFTMIELIFVIVVLGILAAIAVPKLAATRDDAEISKGRATVAAVRSGIVSEHQKHMLTGNTSYVSSLGSDFSNVLSYPVSTGSGRGQWSNSGNNYTYNFGSGTVTFTYDSTTGKFTCSSGSCDKFK